MPKGIATDPQIRANATRKAIEALAHGVPTGVVATSCGIRPRTMYKWLQGDPQAYAARVSAITSGMRFAHVRDGNLTNKQLEFRKQQALRRLSPNRPRK